MDAIPRVRYRNCNYGKKASCSLRGIGDWREEGMCGSKGNSAYVHEEKDCYSIECIDF